MSESVRKLLRMPVAFSRTGDSRSGGYAKIADGLYPRPVKIGIRSVAVPEHEIDALIRARTAGKSSEEVRNLVAELHAKRKEAA